MEPKCIGIVGGAGPLAGSLLLERVLSLANQQYGCYKDADFPKIFLISFPFSDMLCQHMDSIRLQQELSSCLKLLRSNGSAIITIACNTLHAFLDDKDDLDDLVHLPRTLADIVQHNQNPLVLCTSTSVQFGLHKKYFPCVYPDRQTQQEVDAIIDQVLKGADKGMVLKKLERLIQEQPASTIILGCTELSIFSDKLEAMDKTVIDPLDIVANKLLEISLSFNKLNCWINT